MRATMVTERPTLTRPAPYPNAVRAFIQRHQLFSFYVLAFGLLGGGLLEELGWTGFAVPRCRQTHSILGAGLSVGLLWGAYHFSVIFWATNPSTYGPLGIAILFAQLFAWLPAYRVLMVWVYEHTQSLLLA